MKPIPELSNVEALIFDVFGTTTNWRSAVERELKRLGKKHNLPDDYAWEEFAQEWRMGYLDHTQHIANGGKGSSNTDVVHREFLEHMLQKPQWTEFAIVLNKEERDELAMIWHTLDTYPDTVSGLTALKDHFLVIAFSNGNLRLLLDMAKHSKLPWDAVLSTELFNTFKPHPSGYQGVLNHLSLPSNPTKTAMVASHAFDLRGAKNVGMKTVYVHRQGEETVKDLDVEKEFDVVVDSFEALLTE